MKSHISKILIFSNDGKKRELKLDRGVNIITGNSKTGKSALVEIIDYCFCSKGCTIPKGKITDFASLYALEIEVNDINYILARNSLDNGGKMYFVKKDYFSKDEINLKDFEGLETKSFKDAQKELEEVLGLLVTNTAVDIGEKKKKASLRNMVSYLFQHQNLMASKFALFYRFSDFYKRKEVIEQFPIFAGMIGQEYYSDLLQLGNLKVQYQRKQRNEKIESKSKEYAKEKLASLLTDYYAFFDMKFEQKVTLKNINKLISKLPEFDNNEMISEDGIVDRYNTLNNELEELRNQEREIILKIKSLNSMEESGNSYTRSLAKIKEQTDIITIKSDKYLCPICGQECEELLADDEELRKSMNWLEEELEVTKRYAATFLEDVRKLEVEEQFVKEKIKNKIEEIKTIEDKYISSKELLSKREKIYYARAQIEVNAQILTSGLYDDIDEQLESLKEEIDKLQEKINSFQLEDKKKEAEKLISDNMNRLAENLDFEDEYSPINLIFSIVDESFDLYQEQNNKEKIHLYEMGSGANWVSCHVALFLSLLRYFSCQKDSPMPLIMFFDQPSQVYILQSDSNETGTNQVDSGAVSRMYKTIFDEVNSIGEDTGVLPQLIVVDHVDGKNLECEDEFKAYIKANWRDGKALI